MLRNIFQGSLHFTSIGFDINSDLYTRVHIVRSRKKKNEENYDLKRLK